MTKMKPLDVSYERCHEVLEICEPSPLRLEKESGLKWRVNRGSRARAGNWAGTMREKERQGKLIKYWLVRIDSRLYYISRIVYFMHHGVDPYPMEIDHKDRNSMNNNVDNLRLGDRALQSQNQKMPSTNTSGVKGVHWHKQTSKWRADIWIGNKCKYLGRYRTLKEAAEARNAAVREYWPKEAWEANLIDLNLIKN